MQDIAEVAGVVNQDIADHMEEGRTSFRAVLDAAVYTMLRPAALLLSVTLLAWAYSHLQRPRQVGIPLMLVALVSAAVLLLFAVLFKRLKIPKHYANPVAAAIAGVLLLHRFLGLALTLDVTQTTSLVLIVVGAGFIVLSTPWLLVIMGVTLLSWLGIALASSQLMAWSTFGLELISATALAAIIHSARLQAYRRQESLRVLNMLRNQELERRALQLETLFTAGHTISAILDLEVLLNYVVDLVQERFGYYYVGIFRPDASGQYMISKAGTGVSGQSLTEEGFRLKIGEEGLIGWVAYQRKPVWVNNVTKDPRYFNADEVQETHSELVLPLEAGRVFLGVLDIQSDVLNAFSEDDVQVFQSLADQVAIAIQNASRYEEERSRRLLTETLLEVGRALSQTLDLKRVLDLILSHLVKLVPFDRGSVMLQRDSELEIVAAWGFPPESNPLQIRVPLREEDVFGKIHRTKEPLSIDEVLELEHSDWHNVEDLPQARSWVGLPFVNAEDEVIGMLSLTRETPDPFSRSQVDLAITFAGHAAFALQNARLYSELTQAYAQLERMDRTKTDFITIASHELRTPLTILRGYSQILLKDPAIRQSPTQSEMVNGIYTGAVRLHEIVDSMVDMAKLDSRAWQLYIEAVSFPKLFTKLQRRFAKDLQERKLTLTVASLDDLPVIKGDSEALEKVFYHLIVNAIKYTPDEGKITVSGRALPPGELNVLDGGVEIVVSDTGIGINPDLHDLIFAKFYQTGEVALHSSGRTKFKGGGPGLGLSIVKGIVESHGGQIWVESLGYDEETCPGSHFHVVIPLVPPCAIDGERVCAQ